MREFHQGKFSFGLWRVVKFIYCSYYGGGVASGQKFVVGYVCYMKNVNKPLVTHYKLQFNQLKRSIKFHSTFVANLLNVFNVKFVHFEGAHTRAKNTQFTSLTPLVGQPRTIP